MMPSIPKISLFLASAAQLASPTLAHPAPASADLAVRQAGFTCPMADIAATACMGPKDCLYPNAANCNTYIQCTVNADGVTGTPVVKPCQAPLLWNDNQKWCDYPESSTCPKV